MVLMNGLRRAARLYPGRRAILHDRSALTWHQFFQRVLCFGQALKALGVQRGDRVAILSLNSPRYLEAYYATAAIGAVVVPLNIRWGPDETAFTLRDSGANVLILDDRFAHVRCETVSVIVFSGDGECPPDAHPYEKILAAAEPTAEPDVNEDDLAGLFYTSGTTGGPKGVMLTHRNLFTHALQMIAETGINQDWVWLHAAPMFHLANGAMMYALVFMGASHCFLPVFEPEALLQAIERHKVTAVILVPTMWNALINHPSLNRYDTSSLQWAMYGASPMPIELLRRCRERFGPIFLQGYGMTESSPVITLLRKEDHDLEARHIASAGRAAIGVELRVVDDQDRDVPVGTPGEIVMRGPNRMKGYWRRPEASAEVLRGGWLHTGDIGALDEDGFLYILDRKKDMIKTGGENVYSPEVESVLASHPGIMEAVVFGVPDAKWGESIKAAVVLRPDFSATPEDIISWCRARLTHFKCPASVDFHEALPKGGTGKVQKNVLRAPYWEGHAKGVN